MTNLPAYAPMRHLTIQNRDGNHQHYYHFLLGILLPLCRYLAETGEATIPLIVRSCGPCDAILHELDLPQLLLAETESHRNLGNSLPPEIVRKVGIIGFDIGAPALTYDRDAILAGARWLLDRWREPIAGYRTRILTQWKGEPRVLVIDRAPPDPFYGSALSTSAGKGAGASRRRIPNHKEMAAEVRRRYPGCLNVFLERQPLAVQIALFQLADVVVAQHGAALANIVWMRPDARIIEFVGGAPDVGFFVDLAAALGIAHAFFPQEGPFGPIDGGALADAIGKMLEARVSA